MAWLVIKSQSIVPLVTWDIRDVPNFDTWKNYQRLLLSFHSTMNILAFFKEQFTAFSIVHLRIFYEKLFSSMIGQRKNFSMNRSKIISKILSSREKWNFSSCQLDRDWFGRDLLVHEQQQAMFWSFSTRTLNQILIGCHHFLNLLPRIIEFVFVHSSMLLSSKLLNMLRRWVESSKEIQNSKGQ